MRKLYRTAFVHNKWLLAVGSRLPRNILSGCASHLQTGYQ